MVARSCCCFGMMEQDVVDESEGIPLRMQQQQPASIKLRCITVSLHLREDDQHQGRDLHTSAW